MKPERPLAASGAMNIKNKIGKLRYYSSENIRTFGFAAAPGFAFASIPPSRGGFKIKTGGRVACWQDYTRAQIDGASALS
jgi:hypothetical protein